MFGAFGFLAIIGILFLLFWLQKREAAFLGMVKVKNDALEKSNLQKDKLFSIVSHDLRGPLNTLNMFFEMLLNKQVSEEELEEMLPEIKSNLEGTLNLTNNLMSWSNNLGAKPIPMNVAISAIVLETKELFQTSLKEKNIDFQISIPDDLRTNVDKHTVDLVIRNLVANAIKYSNKGGTINVSASVDKEYLTCSVEDTGIGMSDAIAQRLFSQNMDSAIGTKDEKGNGIGLLLCNSFIQYNKGEIWVEYSEINKGTKISFRLPVTS